MTVILELLVVVVAVEAVVGAAVEEVAVDLLAALKILQTRKNKKKTYVFMLNIVYNTTPLLQPQNNLNNEDLS